jgi:ribonuclease P protein component
MLPPVSRLRSSDEIREVVNRGKRTSSKLLILHYLPAGSNRFAVVASKAVGGAVTRNQVKRRFRAALVSHLDQRPFISGVFRVRPGAEKLGFEQLRLEIEEILGKIQ